MDPYADVDVITNDSFGRKLCHICHIREILYDSCHLCDVVDAAISRAFGQNRGRNRDRCAAWVSVLYPPVVTFVSRRAYD